MSPGARASSPSTPRGAGRALFPTAGTFAYTDPSSTGFAGTVTVTPNSRSVSLSASRTLNIFLRVGEEQGYWPRREIVSTPDRFRPGASDVMALRVGYDKLNRETGWEPQVSWEDGIGRTIAWYAANRERWIGRVDWLPIAKAPMPAR